MRALAPLGSLIIAIVLALVGCSTPYAPVLLPLSQKIALEPNQGILVVEVEASEAVSRVAIEPTDQLAPTITLKDFAAGRYAKLLVLPAGSYRWSEVAMDMNMTLNGRPMIAAWRLAASEDHWRFVVHAGVVNYPGLLVLDRIDGSHLRMYTLNRSAQLLESIRGEGMGLLEDHPIVYSGRGRDDFLEFYTSKAASKIKTKQVQVEPSTPSN